jgi:methyl-accepting chemotaxis protein
MPFQVRRSDLAKLDVLETKFNMYEDLSRQMIDRLEQAVEKISDSNNKIATILTKHDERIDQTIRNDENFIKQLNELRLENKEDHKAVVDRIEKVETKLEDIAKFRWILVGGAIFISFILSQIPVFVDVLTPEPNPAMIERSK